MALSLHYNVYGCFRDPQADIELAKTAIDAGFEGIWIADHFLPWIDSRPYTHHPWTWLGTLLSEIPDVPVGTSVTCPMLRYRPPLLAQAIATLDNMYPGRLNIAVGTGEALNEAHFLEEWPTWDTRAEMLIESIELIRKLWETGEYIEWDGEHFQYDGIKLYTPPNGDIDIHWAGWGPRSCRYAGQHADHFLTVAPPEMIADRILPAVETGLERSGRTLDDIEVTNEVGINYGDPNDLVAELRERGEYIPDETELDNPDPRDIQRVADRELADSSDAELREDNNITDDPNEIIDTLERFEEAGVTRVLLGSSLGDPRATIDVCEDHVIPHFS